jgi:hypothetical protein
VIVKYVDDLENARTAEKVAVEWEYWTDTNGALPPVIFTEYDVNTNFDQNWDFIRATLSPGYFQSFPPDVTELVHDALYPDLVASSPKLSQLTDLGARRLSMQHEDVLPAIHFNIASGRWPVDLCRNPLIPSRQLHLKENA